MKYLFIILISFSLNASDYDNKMMLGEKLFLNTCVSCHGIDGSSNSEIKLAIQPRNLRKSILKKDQFFKIIKYGAHHYGTRADIMPGFKYIFDDNQVEAVATYISSFNKERVAKLVDSVSIEEVSDEKIIAKMLKKGKKIFKRNCIYCHDAKVTGNGTAVLDDKTLLPHNLQKSILTTKQFFLYAKHGGAFWGNMKEDMPAWGKKYDDFTIKSVVYYMNKKIMIKEKDTGEF